MQIWKVIQRAASEGEAKPGLFSLTAQGWVVQSTKIPGYLSQGVRYGDLSPAYLSPNDQREDGVSADHSTEKVSTTTMVSEAPIVNSDVVVSQQVPRNVVAYGTSHVMLEIRDFLARPRYVGSATISTAVLVGTVGTQSVISLVDSDTMFNDKLKGFLGQRYTFVYRAVINASRFQSGSFFMAFEPSWSDKTKLYSFNSNETVPTMKHVIIDLGTETEGILRCPYQGPLNYYDRRSGIGGLGAIHSGAYQRLRVGAGAPTTYNVSFYMSLEDVDLVIPVIPQAGKLIAYDSEQKKAIQKGPIEEALGATASAATALMRIPLLSSYVVPAQWALNIAKNLAGTLGWSRPIQTEALTRVRATYSDFMPNYDAAEVAMPLAASNANKVELYPGAAMTDDDEMSFAYLKSKWSYYSTVTWTTSNIAGAILTSINLHPNNFQITSNVTSNHTLRRPSVISWLQDFFYFYRGGIKLRLRIAKTVMHTGRLIVTYNPGHSSAYPGATTAATLLDSSYLHSHIIDVRDANIIELEFPYTSTQPYLWKKVPYGIVSVIVLNPLIAPETVSSTIDMTIEVAGADDLEFAFRVAPEMRFIVPSGPGLLAVEQNPEIQGLTPLSQFDGIGEGNTVNVGSSASDVLGTLNARLCIGEQMLSIKQLAMISTRCYVNTGFGAQMPGICHFAQEDTLVVTLPTYYCLLDNCMAPYNLCRGSMIHRHFSTDTSLLTLGGLEVHCCANSTTSTSSGAGFGVLDQQLVVSQDNRKDLVSVRSPFYSQTTSHLNAPCISIYGASSYLTSRVLTTFGLKTGATYNGEIYRAAADDLQLSGFIAMPNTVASV